MPKRQFHSQFTNGLKIDGETAETIDTSSEFQVEARFLNAQMSSCNVEFRK